MAAKKNDKKNNNKGLQFGNVEKNFDDIQELSGEVKKQQAKKSASDYFRLDLKPTGYDLKDFIVKKTAAISSVTGKSINITQYIQGLIIDAMEMEKEMEEEHVSMEHETMMTYFDSLDDDTLLELMKVCGNPTILKKINQFDNKKLENILKIMNQLDDKKIAALMKLLDI